MVKFSKYTAILSIIPALFVAFFPGKIMVISTLCYLLLIFIVFKYIEKLLFDIKFEGKFIFLFFYFYGLITFVRGMWNINSTDDINSFIYSSIPIYLLIPLSFYIGLYLKLFGIYTRFFLTYGLFFCFLIYLAPVDSGMYGYGHTITPLYLLALFFPFISFKNKMILSFIIIISVFIDLTNRSNMVNELFICFLIVSYYFSNYKSMTFLYKFWSSTFLVLPFLFIFLAVTGQFNVFQIGDYTDDFVVTDSTRGTQDLFVDSRTSIYVDVFQGLVDNDAVFFGLGSDGKVKTSLVDSDGYYEIYKKGRASSESGMLNYIQWGGIIGCLSLFFVYYKAVYLSVFKSNNFISKMIGMYIAFKFLFSFIEDKIIFNSNSIIIFIALGLCFNEDLRSLDNKKVYKYVQGVMNYKYSF